MDMESIREQCKLLRERVEKFLEEPKSWELVQQRIRWFMDALEEAHGARRHDPWCKCQECVVWASARAIFQRNENDCGVEEAKRRANDPLGWGKKPHVASCTCAGCKISKQSFKRPPADPGGPMFDMDDLLSAFARMHSAHDTHTGRFSGSYAGFRVNVRVKDPRVDARKVLGVDEHATQEQIKSAYRRQAREVHPDVTGGDKAKEERFVQITKAYDLLMQ